MMVLLPLSWLTVADFGYPVYALLLYCSQNFKLSGFPIFRFFSVPVDDYFRRNNVALSKLCEIPSISLKKMRFQIRIKNSIEIFN